LNNMREDIASFVLISDKSDTIYSSQLNLLSVLYLSSDDSSTEDDPGAQNRSKASSNCDDLKSTKLHRLKEAIQRKR
jgi:hypothetical protein